MAYLHCHTEGCGWSQDDFWNLKGFYFWKIGYNPLSVFLSYTFGYKGYWKPRRMDHNSSVIKDYGWSRRDPHSWYLIWYQLKRMIMKFFEMKWWTQKSWEKANAKGAACPKCGERNFDID
jgi:hypothetical protein